MAEIALGILGPAIEVVKWVGAPIKRQFSYLFCFIGNLGSLKDEAENLEYATSVLQERVDSDKNNGREVIYEKVKTWLSNSRKITREKNRILAEATEVGSGCSNFARRFSLSKEAKKTAEAMKELVEKCKFESVSCSPPIAATTPVPFGKVIYEFNSRKRFEEDIMRILNKDKNVDKIGIWGIGGVGKTTMAKKILKRAFDDKLFNEVVDVIVAQKDELHIQEEIGKQLGVTFKVESSRHRMDQLQKRLRQEQRTLILLDDVWKDLNLEELGIPCDSEWCTIILTSRQKDVLKLMKVENICQLGVLDEHEAWDFFKEITGTFVDDPILKPTAYQVMKECKGLLLALEIVGKAHIDMKHPDDWKLSEIELKKHNPKNIEYVIEKVYRPLKRSYDCLGSKDTKLTFLLCSLFPEDADIPLEQLTYFAAGLRLFQDFSELEEVKCCIRKSIDTLKNRSLLLDGSDEDHVRMHDVVRDVSIFITSLDNDENDVGVSIFAASNWVERSDCTWISSHVGGGARRDPPLPESCFPKLKLLWMNNKVEQELEINDNLIGRSTELNVLFIEWGLMKSLPMHTTQALKKSLTTLILLRCESLESVAAVGELKSLEILICRDCHSIKELPEQVRGLKRLKLLEILGCINLERVAGGVISSMVGLEKLKIVHSFKNWKGGEIHEEGNEACLREIELLKKLRYLEVGVSDIALVALPLRLPSKLVQFGVQFGGCYLDSYNQAKESKYEKTMCLDLPDGAYNINWGDFSINIFLSRTEYLRARGKDKEFELNLASAQGIRWLTLDAFTNKKNIVSAVAAFPLLQGLSLECLPNLEEVWDDDGPIPSNSFTNLKHLELNRLQALKRMGKCVLSTANNIFLQLETIKIMRCEVMEHLLLLVPTEEERDKEDGITLSFPKLESVDLFNAPMLSSMICSSGRIESIKFPVLAYFAIADCEKLKCFVSGEDDEHCQDDDNSLHLLCHPKVSFGGLRKLLLLGKMESKNVWCDQIPIDLFTGLVHLRIRSYTKTKRLFSSSKIPQNLVNLKELIIARCPEMVSVIEDEEVSSSCDHTTEHTALFPSLQVLCLYRLPKLESFCEGRYALNLSSLKRLDIYKCHEMKSFVRAPALQTVKIDWKILKPVNDDLNAALHQHFEKAKDAIVQLRKSNPSDIPKDYLDNENAKSTFLLCCLFAEDADIPLENLTCIDMGLRLYEGIWKSEEVRGRMCTLIKMLKTRFLLKRITLHFCDEMEHVIVLPEGAGSDIMIFPKLRSLVSICRGTRSIGFPMLAEIVISCCENMRCLVSSSDGDNSSVEHYRDRDSLHLFCQPKASFPNLQKLSLRSNVESKNAWCDQVPIGFFTGLVELYISKYSKIRTLFSSTSSSSKIPQNLVNLQKLYIEDCEEMLKVIGDEEEVSSSLSSSSLLSVCDDHTTKHTTTHLFPSLQNITLSRMPELESFCEWRCAIQLPSLKMFWIADCRGMKSFNAAAGSLVITPALQIVTIDGEDLEFADDLNATLYQHFEKAN